ncbi:MAG: DUF192 domain-containing protein [Patescibacteria group bacterium]
MSFPVKNKKILLLSAVLFIFLLFLLFKEDEGLDVVDIKVGETEVKAELAQTEEELIRGLSGRRSLGKIDGLLMVFSEEGRHGIWMKDMNFSLDIIWANRSGRIVHIKESVHPNTYPDVFFPDEPALVVLEVRGGKVEKEGWENGDRIILENLSF